MRNALTTDRIMKIRPTTFVRHIVDVASENCERKDGRKSRRMLPGGRNISQPFKFRTPSISAQSLESLSPRRAIRGDSISECTKTLFTWSGGPRSSGVGFFCFHALGDTKQKKPTPLDRGSPLHVNRP